MQAILRINFLRITVIKSLPAFQIVHPKQLLGLAVNKIGEIRLRVIHLSRYSITLPPNLLTLHIRYMLRLSDSILDSVFAHSHPYLSLGSTAFSQSPFLI